MSTDDKRVRDCLEQIQARVDNWAQGNGYGPGGWPRDAPVHDVTFLFNHIADLEEEIDDLEVEAREKNAWEGRYNALLEEAEGSRPRPLRGDGVDMPVGTVVLDGANDAWQRRRNGEWKLIKGAYKPHVTLDPQWGPYTIIYIP